MSKLYFRYGAMNSGKSTALLQVAHNYEERGQAVLLVKPAVDTKGEHHVISRLGGAATGRYPAGQDRQSDQCCRGSPLGSRQQFAPGALSAD